MGKEELRKKETVEEEILKISKAKKRSRLSIIVYSSTGNYLDESFINFLGTMEYLKEKSKTS